MKDVSRREFLKTLCLGITVAALQNLPMTTAFADSAISKTKIISKSDRENLVATVARTVQVYYKLVDCLEKCLIYGHIRRFAD